jgi:hypothetical protein
MAPRGGRPPRALTPDVIRSQHDAAVVFLVPDHLVLGHLLPRHDAFLGHLDLECEV